VFAAIVDSEKMSQYFISGVSGPLKSGAKVDWEFANVGCKKLPADEIAVEQNRMIAFEWSAFGDRTRVTIKLNTADPNTSVVTIKEAKFPMDDAGVKRAMGQTAGSRFQTAGSRLLKRRKTTR
jgi:uncharacterized protein YndB with AHSA1/START domain